MVKIKIKWLVQYQDQGDVGGAGAAIVYGTGWRRQPGGSKGLRSPPGGLALHCFITMRIRVVVDTFIHC